MKRQLALKIINPLLGLLFLNQVLSGIFAEHLTPDQFEVLHEGGGYLFAALVVAHVILNWSWVKANFFKRKPAATAGE